MQELISVIIKLFFVIALVVGVLYSSGGFKDKTTGLKDKSIQMMDDAATKMTTP